MKRSYTPVRSKPVEQTEKNVNKEPTEEEKQFYKKLKNRQSALESRRKAKEKLARLGNFLTKLEIFFFGNVSCFKILSQKYFFKKYF